jgi:hypothetical protein
MTKKYQLMFLTIFIVLALALWSACSPRTTTPQYDNFKYPALGFSIDYPKGWNIRSVTPHEEASGHSVFIDFDNPPSSLEISVSYDTILSYHEWFDMFNSPKAVDKLETKDAKEGATTYSTFTQLVDDTFTRIYVVDAHSGTVLIMCSFADSSTTDEVKDLMCIYALHMIDSIKIDNTEIE